MGLFTDGLISSLADLRAYEHSIVETAHIEGIEVQEKLSLAQREIGLAITGFLLRRHSELGPHRSLENVVVTEPMAHAHALHTIALIYRDAYGTQLNERYSAKWREYRGVAEQALRALFDIGIGLVSAPVARASAPTCVTVPGGSMGPRSYYVGVCLENWNGQCGATSEAVMVDVAPNELLAVRMPSTPSGARGYHVFAGTSPELMQRQTRAALAVTEAYVEPADGLFDGLPGITTQRPDYYVMNRRNLLRG